MSLFRLRRPPPKSPAPEPSRDAPPAPLSGTGPTLMDLPPELHLQISKYLIYPDALSLKQSCRYFHSLVYTGVELKIEWLVQRRSLHLECPSHTRCDLGSDLRFCRGSVALLMKRRREHIECETRPGLGCVVYSTPTCSHRRSAMVRWATWLRTTFTFTEGFWWLLIALIPLGFCGAWFAEFWGVPQNRTIVE